jgi:DNA-binding transcriptional ArsR family regulator
MNMKDKKKKTSRTKVVICDLDEKAYSKYFKAFGDPSRLKILSLLSGGEMTVNDIVDAMHLSQPTVSRHLAILREADVVIDRRDGQRVFYRLNKDSVLSCCTGFCDCLMVDVKKPKKSKKK